jgi:cadmium resistance protein CadD (predicted permease)
LAAGLGADLGVAAAAFVGTNVDNCVVIMAMVAGAPPQRAHRIAAGQAFGFAVLVAVSAAAAAVLFEFSAAVVGLLGLVPGAIRTARPRPARRPRRHAGAGAGVRGPSNAPWVGA